METFISVCQKTGIDVSLPENIMGSCCSQIFSSKGFRDAQVYSGNKIIQQLWEASHEGRYPIVNDVSSCAYTLQQLRPFLSIENQSKFDRLTILDSVTFLHQYVLPRSVLSRKKKSVVVHPVCAVQKMRTETEFIQVARHFAEEVVVPKNSGCCGMAGDRGFILPELTESATAAEAKEVRQRQYDGYYSSTKTCEMAMSQAVRENYESLLYLVDESLDARP
jgi:D-lactate dehydrogenase